MQTKCAIELALHSPAALVKTKGISIFPCSFGHRHFLHATTWAISDGSNYAKWDRQTAELYVCTYVHICTLYLHVHRAVIGFLHLALGHVFESSKAKRVEGPRGHSTTTWTKFYPILTPSPLEWTNMDILHILSTLYHMTPVDFLLTPFPLFLST